MKWLKENWFKLFIILFLSLFLAGIAVFIGHRIKQDQLNYAAKRRAECYEIYVKECEQSNNVQGPEYDSKDDVCRIRYNRSTPMKKDCGKSPGSDDKVLFNFWFDCFTNTSSREF